jgi:hypothetical protein
MLKVIFASVTIKFIVLNVIMLSVFYASVIILNVVAPVAGDYAEKA